MSIKDLFGKTSKSLEDTVQDVESVKFVEEKTKKQERYLPPVDFSDPKNFAFYGSAQLYYEAAIKRIYEDYPYDGSKAEQIEFEEKASHLERWMFESKYPRTTGYIELGTTGNFTGTSGIFQTTDKPEYIRVWGGLHTQDTTRLEDKFNKSAKYDESKNRNQNWNCDFDNGVTIEFWMKKNVRTSTTREVILDLWNGATGSDNFRLVLDFMDLGASSYLQFTVNTEGTLNNRLLDLGAVDVEEWNHYAISIVNDTTVSSRVIFYLNGDEIESFNTWANLSSSGKIDGWIGALQTELVANVGETYAGKLQAQLDEFRFWKTCRTSRQIKLNWFSSVGGGANTDDATSDLGVYLKFNEGIVGNSLVDSVILDYSGRLANGQWIGYPGSSARFTGSAIEDRGYKETKTPIIYSDHPDVKALISEMSTSGSVYDADRGQSFYRSMPTWLQEEDYNGNLRLFSQILASYLDTLHVQIKELTELKTKRYPSDNVKPSTMAADLLKDKGFMISTLFDGNEVFEKLASVNLQDAQIDTDLSEIKNTIYTNIYNNLEKIYKSKGTEGSIRNLIRCFGVDDELIRLNLYTDGGVQYFTDKARETSVRKKFINFNNPNNFEASIYQTSSADNPNTFIYGSHTLIDGSRNAFTLEADIVVPYKKEVGESGYFGTPFVSSSVFGFHEANETDATDYTWVSFPAVSATGEVDFENILFPSDWENRTITLTSTDGTVRTYEFTDASGATGEVLGNGNINVDISPTEFWRTTRNFQDAVNSANGHAGKISASWTTGSYIVSLSQVEPGAAGNTTIQYDFKDSIIIVTDFHDGADARENMNLQVYLVKDSQGSRNAKFVLKNELETIYQESDWIYDIYENEHYNVAIRIKPQTYPYAGGVTNTTPDYDIELYAVTNNLGDIEEEVLLSEVVSYDVGSKYIRAPKRVYAGAHIINFTGSVDKESDIQIGGVRAWLDYLTNEEIFQHNKDPLNYGTSRSMDGANPYTIDGVQIPSRELTILNWDFDTVLTSDSNGEFDVEDITSGATDTIYGWIDDIIRREHKAKGSGFLSEDSSFLSNEFLFAKKKQLPEAAYDADNIYIKGEQEINFSDDDDVSDNLFILEKSPSALVSEEMLKSFSTTLEFANLFARPVERFRVEYKDLAHARDLFFQRVESDLDFDRFFEYFKWIDSSISSMVNQLIPLSANFAGGIVDVIEPHILERDKYQRQIGLLNTVTSTEASIKGRQELGYNWRIGHAPIPNVDDPSQYAFWQRERRERDETEREQLRQVAIRQTDQEYTNPINLSSSIGVVSGNTYATRRLSRTYEMGIDFRNSIHGGINYDKGKDRDFLKTVVTPHGEVGGSGAPVNIMTIGVGEGHGLIPTGSWTDVNPNELVKLDGHAQVGKFSNLSNNESLDPEYDFYYRRKISDVFPGNIISSSVETGYASTINRSGDDQGYNYGTNVVNLHSDTTDITNEIPAQGPFTQQWVGGRQERHVDIATGSYDNDTRYLRPEAWRFLVGTNPLEYPSDNDGAIGFTGPDYGAGYPNHNQAKAIFYREERAKRPVNIKNIQTIFGTGSHGNYIRGYEVFSTFGDQGYYLRRADQLLPQEIAEALPETTNYHTLIAQTSSINGNFFGEGNNRQYGYTIAGSPEIPPQQASDSTFSVYGLSQQTDGSGLRIQNDAGDSWIYETPTITGADSTEFYNNLKTEIQNDLGSFFSVTYQEQNNSTSYPSLRVQFKTLRTNDTGLETNNSYDPNKYPKWNGGGTNWAFSSFVTFNKLENDGSVSVIYAENTGTSATAVDRVTVREIMINRNLDRLIFNHRYYDSGGVIRVDTYSMDYTGIINEGQSHHLIITQDDKIGYDISANEPTVRVFVDGQLRPWTQTPSTVHPTPHSAIDLKSVVLTTNFIDESATYSIGLTGEDVGASEMDESTVYNILVDSTIASEIYNNAAPWEATNPTLQFVNFNYATDVEARWTFSDDVGDFSDTRILDDVTGNGNDLIVYEPNEGTYDKIRQGTGISYVDEQADFTISPYNVGSYGNLNLEIDPASGDNSFFDIVDGVGGVNFVPAVEDQRMGNIIDTQDRSTGSAHVIRSRFSAPGGPEINSSGYLDVATQQYSVHNSINFRNLTLRGPSSGEDDRIRLDTHQVTVSEGRREGLKTLRARHQGKFGIESKYGEISDTGYDTNASFHKVHRNNRLSKVSRTTMLTPANPEPSEDAKIIATTSSDAYSTLFTPVSIVSFWAKMSSQISNKTRFLFASRDRNSESLDVLETVQIFFVAGSPLLNILSGGWFCTFFVGDQFVDLTEWNHFAIELPSFSNTSYGGDPTSFKLFINKQQMIQVAPPTNWFGINLLGWIRDEIYLYSSLYNTDEFGEKNLQGQMANVSYYGRDFSGITQEELEVMSQDSVGDEVSGLIGFKNFWSLDCSQAYNEGQTISDGHELVDYQGAFSAFVYYGEGPEVYTAEDTPFTSQIDFEYIYDNDNYTSLIPASDYQYSWIKQTVASGSNDEWRLDHPSLFYAPKSGLSQGENGYVSSINFPTISDFSCDKCSEDYPIEAIIEWGTTPKFTKLNDFSALLLDTESNDAVISTADLDTLKFYHRYAECCDEIGYTLTYEGSPNLEPSPTVNFPDVYINPGCSVDFNFKAYGCDPKEISTILFTLSDASLQQPGLVAYMQLFENGSPKTSREEDNFTIELVPLGTTPTTNQISISDVNLTEVNYEALNLCSDSELNFQQTIKYDEVIYGDQSNLPNIRQLFYEAGSTVTIEEAIDYRSGFLVDSITGVFENASLEAPELIASFTHWADDGGSRVQETSTTNTVFTLVPDGTTPSSGQLTVIEANDTVFGHQSDAKMEDNCSLSFAINDGTNQAQTTAYPVSLPGEIFYSSDPNDVVTVTFQAFACGTDYNDEVIVYFNNATLTAAVFEASITYPAWVMSSRSTKTTSDSKVLTIVDNADQVDGNVTITEANDEVLFSFNAQNVNCANPSETHELFVSDDGVNFYLHGNDPNARPTIVKDIGQTVYFGYKVTACDGTLVDEILLTINDAAFPVINPIDSDGDGFPDNQDTAVDNAAANGGTGSGWNGTYG